MTQIQWFTQHTLTAIVLLVIAFVLCAAIGLERERQLKSAGLRTHTLVGLGSALFTLVGVYGFEGMLPGDIRLDPSRIAAQVVSGIGFIGAGVIFVRKTVVSGLTTAASIWVAAAVGMAAGAGMPTVAAAATVLYFAAVVALSGLGRWVVAHHAHGAQVVQLRYREGSEAMRSVLECLGAAGCDATLVGSSDSDHPDGDRTDVTIRVEHPKAIPGDLVEQLRALEGVTSVHMEADLND